MQAAANAEKHLSASPAAGFLVGGISSGANFAGVIAYTARDAGLSPPITGLFVSIPVCIMPQAYHLVHPEWKDQLLSLEQNADNPLLTPKSLTDIQGQFISTKWYIIHLLMRNGITELYGSPPDDPRISFLLNSDHSSLPTRAYFQICGGDPLRDEALLWQKLLQERSGTKTKVHLYSGMPHGFWRFLQMKASQEWLEDLLQGVRFLCAPEDEVEASLIIKGI